MKKKINFLYTRTFSFDYLVMYIRLIQIVVHFKHDENKVFKKVLNLYSCFVTSSEQTASECVFFTV